MQYRHNHFTEIPLSLTCLLAVPTTTTAGPPVPGCDGEPLVLTSQNGHVTSPGFGEGQFYHTNLFCQWVLLGNPGEVFKISFTSFMLEQSPTCDYDNFTVSDAGNILDMFNNEFLTNSTDLTNFTELVSGVNTSTGILLSNDSSLSKTKTLLTACGYHLPYDVETKSHIAVLTFISDEQVGGRGFNLTYTTTEPTCEMIN